MAKFAGFAGGLASGLASGLSIGKALKQMREDDALKQDIAAASQQNQATDMAAGDEALQHFQENYVPQEGGPQTAREFLLQNPEAFSGLNGRKAGYAVADKEFGDKAAAQIAARGLNMQAVSDVLARHGKLDDAARVAAAGLSLRKAEQAQADDDEVRRVLSGGVAGMLTKGKQSGDRGDDSAGDLDRYLARVPNVVATYVKQGRIDEAKRYADWADSEEGKAYATSWLKGMRRHAVGDDAGALEAWSDLYNRNLYADGRTIKLTPLGGGKQYLAEQLDGDGNLVGSMTGNVTDLAKQAALALSPQKAIEYHAQQQAKRDAEAALLDRNIQLEQLRQQGQEAREDRRDDRLAKRLQADAERRTAGSGLSLTQQRGNAEIDAARQAVADLSPEEIRKRTAPTTATGRENPDFDPSLARAAKLAGRRKVGNDELFDRRQRQQPASVDRSDVAKRFRADPAMNSYRLGKEVEGGRVEVLDKQGRVIGHFE